MEISGRDKTGFPKEIGAPILAKIRQGALERVEILGSEKIEMPVLDTAKAVDRISREIEAFVLKKIEMSILGEDGNTHSGGNQGVCWT